MDTTESRCGDWPAPCNCDEGQCPNDATALPRFFIFAGGNYYPGGGVSDLIGCYATLEEMDAEADRVRRAYDWSEFMELTPTGFINAPGY